MEPIRDGSSSEGGSAESEDEHTRTAGIGQLGSRRVGEENDAALALGNRAHRCFRLGRCILVNPVADREAVRTCLSDGVFGPMLQVVDDYVLVGLELEGAITVGQKRAFDTLALRVVADDRIIRVFDRLRLVINADVKTWVSAVPTTSV